MRAASTTLTAAVMLTLAVGRGLRAEGRVDTVAELDAALARLERRRVRELPPEIYRRDGYGPAHRAMWIYRVTPPQRALPLVGRLTVGDFLSPELRFSQSWLYQPLHIDASGDQYVLLDRRVLLKLLWVVTELRRQGHDDDLQLFAQRTERINRYLHDVRRRAFGRTSLARRSFHLLGRALDLVVGDLDRDGQVDLKDQTLLVCAIEAVERRHPDLLGGLGLYERTVHTDVRGKRVRWCGRGGNRSPLCDRQRLNCGSSRQRLTGSEGVDIGELVKPDRRPLRASRTSIAVAAASLIAVAGHARAAESWRTVANVHGMLVMMRDTPGRSFPTIRVVARVDENIFDLLAVLSDPARYTEWMERFAESRVLARPNELEYDTYSLVDAPWPVSDRDSVYRSRATVSPSQRLVMVRFRAIRDPRVPPRKGVVRLETLQGYYGLKVLGPRRTQLDYELDADPGGWLPKWIGKITAKDAAINTIRALPRQVARTRGSYGPRVELWRAVAKRLGLTAD